MKDIVINMRATEWQRQLIDWGAQEIGISRSQFILQAAKQDAVRVIAANEKPHILEQP